MILPDTPPPRLRRSPGWHWCPGRWAGTRSRRCRGSLPGSAPLCGTSLWPESRVHGRPSEGTLPFLTPCLPNTTPPSAVGLQTLKQKSRKVYKRILIHLHKKPVPLRAAPPAACAACTSAEAVWVAACYPRNLPDCLALRLALDAWPFARQLSSGSCRPRFWPARSLFHCLPGYLAWASVDRWPSGSLMAPIAC